MSPSEWSEACRLLYDKTKREFDGYTFESFRPADFKAYALEAEYRHRQALMQLDNAENALIFGEQATPVAAIIGGFVSFIFGVWLFLFVYRWLGGGWRGASWVLGIMALAGLLLEYSDSKPHFSFWQCVALAAAGIVLLLVLIGLLSLSVTFIGRLSR